MFGTRIRRAMLPGTAASLFQENIDAYGKRGVAGVPDKTAISEFVSILMKWRIKHAAIS